MVNSDNMSLDVQVDTKGGHARTSLISLLHGMKNGNNTLPLTKRQPYSSNQVFYQHCQFGCTFRTKGDARCCDEQSYELAYTKHVAQNGDSNSS